MRKAIFLDRDGVLNQTIFRDGKPRAPYRLEDFILFPGVPEAINLLRDAGYALIVVTNQPDVARGWVSRENVDLVNDRLREIIQVDDIKVCFHVESDKCQCRKPLPGMLIEAANEWNINTAESFMIGDRYSDIAAGKAAGCKSLLIGDGDEQGQFPAHDGKFNSLLDASKWILEKTGRVAR